MEKLVDAGWDEPSPRDYKFTEVFGVAEMPDYVFHNRTEIFNQGEKHEPSTTYACTCYSATHCVNEANAIEFENQEIKAPVIDPVGIWKIALKRGAKVDRGWSLQGSANLMKDKGYISGTTVCRGLMEVKSALSRGQLVQTGSRNIDFKETKKNNNVAVRGEGYGHLFMVAGYDEAKKWLICRNSYGDIVYDKGYFYVKYKDFDVLYTCVSYADKENKEIKEYQFKKRMELAREKGYYNGLDNNKLLIRQDGANIALRVGKKESTDGIYNGQNKLLPVTRQEYKTMLERASGGKILFDIGLPNDTITRGEGATWSVRLTY